MRITSKYIIDNQGRVYNTNPRRFGPVEDINLTMLDHPVVIDQLCITIDHHIYHVPTQSILLPDIKVTSISVDISKNNISVAIVTESGQLMEGYFDGKQFEVSMLDELNIIEGIPKIKAVIRAECYGILAIIEGNILISIIRYSQEEYRCLIYGFPIVTGYSNQHVYSQGILLDITDGRPRIIPSPPNIVQAITLNVSDARYNKPKSVVIMIDANGNIFTYWYINKLHRRNAIVSGEALYDEYDRSPGDCKIKYQYTLDQFNDNKDQIKNYIENIQSDGRKYKVSHDKSSNRIISNLNSFCRWTKLIPAEIESREQHAGLINQAGKIYWINSELMIVPSKLYEQAYSTKVSLMKNPNTKLY